MTIHDIDWHVAYGCAEVGATDPAGDATGDRRRIVSGAGDRPAQFGLAP
ncbi:hypothetical protein OHB01_15610 [Microbispora hainanensis]|uniref:Uncharacterized protein n=1 Tax=Microbispora hainanensis TaxID=568844 RepID=A0ABZ1SH24_9ACTN|nr:MULTISPECIES: hypothetical protein [Microbispora]NJP28751.1 hypothetical protein [Microbispora sp. CL1-1]